MAGSARDDDATAERERARTIFERVETGIVVVAMDGTITDANPAFTKMAAFDRAELVGRRLVELFHPDDIDRDDVEEPSAVVGNARSEETRTVQQRLVRKDGTVVWVRARVAPLLGLHRPREAAVCTFEDVTEEKRAEALRTFAARLQETNKELQELASIASHDLQEPLRKIRALSERLTSRNRDVLGEEGIDDLDRMQRAAGRMQNLIDNLLSYARAGAEDRPFTRVSLRQVVREVMVDLEARIEETGGTLDIGVLPTIDADPVQMRQLLQNLFSNALKFHRPGVPPAVRVSATLLASWDGQVSESRGEAVCRIEVTDNGIGLPEEHKDRIFSVFHRLHGRKAYEGRGVGLAICRKIAARHRGTIAAESTPGEGARFIVTLPVRQRRAAE